MIKHHKIFITLCALGLLINLQAMDQARASNSQNLPQLIDISERVENTTSQQGSTNNAWQFTSYSGSPKKSRKRICSFCHIKFDSNADLKQHIQNGHGLHAIDENPTAKTAPVNYSFHDSKERKAKKASLDPCLSISYVDGVKKYSCVVCKVGPFHSSNWKRHLTAKYHKDNAKDWLLKQQTAKKNSSSPVVQALNYANAEIAAGSSTVSALAGIAQQLNQQRNQSPANNHVISGFHHSSPVVGVQESARDSIFLDSPKLDSTDDEFLNYEDIANLTSEDPVTLNSPSTPNAFASIAEASVYLLQEIIDAKTAPQWDERLLQEAAEDLAVIQRQKQARMAPPVTIGRIPLQEITNSPKKSPRKLVDQGGVAPQGAKKVTPKTLFF
jgi:hypothetical protein